MATPKTGAISMSDFNTELRQVSSGSQVSVSDIRARTGYSGAAVSFSNLRNMYSATITNARFDFNPDPKVTVWYTGFKSGTGGSVDSNDVAPSSSLTECSTAEGFTDTYIITTPGVTGYLAANVTKVVLATSVFTSGFSVFSNTNMLTVSGYAMANSGTTTLALQYA